ncbi:hypothetical protein EG346_02150 [Chryseobacterium carnipullorum]|uniref:Uncharacterized protein n=1 Tax=Chryseobacterium carnipullorum TaxID=1124835 RepID=A0A376EF00_CHRCU|nr:hypothetical protein EG346_02150 [Chryseobacterium carnipullorum]AZA66420.1 hypothetical protein EG345_18260 [Chryseobacterium carnipullorum]STD07676.1 Uncharacterised protein [Chryseobacterium carnipullorum]
MNFLRIFEQIFQKRMREFLNYLYFLGLRGVFLILLSVESRQSMLFIGVWKIFYLKLQILNQAFA